MLYIFCLRASPRISRLASYRGLVIQESLTNASASCMAFQQPAGGCWFSISPIIVLAAVKNGVKYQSNP